MFSMITDLTERILGRGEYSVTIPVMDGPLRPNQALEEKTRSCVEMPFLDNLIWTGRELFFTSGNNLMRLPDVQKGTPETVKTFDDLIASLALLEDGGLAVGLDGNGIYIHGGSFDGLSIQGSDKSPLNCPTAILAVGDMKIVVCNGSSQFPASKWKHDLMSLGRSGQVYLISLETKAIRQLSGGLSFPYGLACYKGEDILVSEAWKHRVLKVSLVSGRKPEPILSRLPGYPARIMPASFGGYWMTLFAARNQLVEFVLRENAYRKRMIAEIDPEYWIAPAYTTGVSFKEPLQGDGVKTMGIIKPWAPPRSYGLLVYCDQEFQPIASWHSRADGKNHAITSVAEFGGEVFMSAKGQGRILSLSVTQAELEEDA